MTPHEAILALQRRMKTAIIGQQHVIQRLLLDARVEVHRVEVSDAMEQYTVALIAATRRPKELSEPDPELRSHCRGHLSRSGDQ